VTAGRLHYSRFWQRLIDELKSITFDPSGATVKYEGKPHDDCVDMVLNALDGVVPQPDEDENEQEEQMALEDMMPQFRRVAAGAAGHGLDMRRPDLMGEPVRAGAAAL